MSSLREQILADIATRLATIASVTVQRSRVVPVKRSDGIVIVVTPVDETATPQLQDAFLRELRVITSVRARGAIPDQVADPTAVAVYAKLMGTQDSRTLGGLAVDILELSREFAMDEADLDAIDYQILWQVAYMTSVADEATGA